MKFTLLTLVASLLQISATGQGFIPNKSINNSLVASFSFNVTDTRAMRNAIYQDSTLTVEAVSTQYVPYTVTNKLYWKRTSAGIVSTGSFPIPSAGSDFVIGDNGNKILFVWFGVGIEFRLYTYSSGTYILSNLGTVTPAVYNPPASVMQYANPELSIDQNDNVVLLYNSFNAGPYNSDVIGFFAKTGDINGNWSQHPNNFNAFEISSGISLLPNQFEGFRGDVAMTKYSSNNTVNFIFPARNVSGTNYIFHAQINFNDITANNTNALAVTVLASSSSSEYFFPSIDCPNRAIASNIGDDWVAAYDEIHGKNDIRIVKGSSGSFITSPFISNTLNLSRQLGPPDIQYLGDTIGLVFSSNDTSTSCKDGFDAFFIEFDTNVSSLTPLSYTRVNSDSNFVGDQMSVSISAPIRSRQRPFISYFNQSTNELINASIDSSIICNSYLSLPTPQIFTTKEVSKTEIYQMDGRLIKTFEGDCQYSNLHKGTFIIIRHYSDGTVKRTKEGIL